MEFVNNSQFQIPEFLDSLYSRRSTPEGRPGRFPAARPAALLSVGRGRKQIEYR